MKTINTITNERITKVLFPDNQPHVVIHDVNPGDNVRVVAPIRSSLELVQLLMISSAVGIAGGDKFELIIPYLMGARYDRVMNEGDSFDLEVIARAINSCGFKSVHLFDVHSRRSLELIANSCSHNNSRLVKSYSQPNAVLIVPDKGAKEKFVDYKCWNENIVDFVLCEKTRDLQKQGRVTLQVLEPKRCNECNCVIIDDICDGGATFLAIAKQIMPKHLTLIVSHGIFSKGFEKLEEYFDEIITTDSFQHHAANKVTTIPLNL